jgi:hypothetical protein
LNRKKNIAEEEKQELQALKQSYYNKLQKLEAQKRDIGKTAGENTRERTAKGSPINKQNKKRIRADD